MKIKGGARSVLISNWYERSESRYYLLHAMEWNEEGFVWKWMKAGKYKATDYWAIVDQLHGRSKSRCHQLEAREWREVCLKMGESRESTLWASSRVSRQPVTFMKSWTSAVGKPKKNKDTETEKNQILTKKILIQASFEQWAGLADNRLLS